MHHVLLTLLPSDRLSLYAVRNTQRWWFFFKAVQQQSIIILHCDSHVGMLLNNDGVQWNRAVFNERSHFITFYRISTAVRRHTSSHQRWFQSHLLNWPDCWLHWPHPLSIKQEALILKSNYLWAKQQHDWQTTRMVTFSRGRQVRVCVCVFICMCVCTCVHSWMCLTCKLCSTRFLLTFLKRWAVSELKRVIWQEGRCVAGTHAPLWTVRTWYQRVQVENQHMEDISLSALVSFIVTLECCTLKDRTNTSVINKYSTVEMRKCLCVVVT